METLIPAIQAPRGVQGHPCRWARQRPAQEAPCAAHRAPARALHHERHRPEQTMLYRLVQQHVASFIAHTEARRC